MTTPRHRSHPAAPEPGPEPEEITGKIQLEKQLPDAAEADWAQHYEERWGDQGDAWEAEAAARDAKWQLELEAGQ
jgi:hypothetical protein